MSTFEASFDFDDALLDNVSVNCPECGKQFDISLNNIGSSVTCPHCNASVEISAE